MIHGISLSRSMAMLALLLCCLLDTQEDKQDSFKRPTVKEKKKVEHYSQVADVAEFPPGTTLYIAAEGTPVSDGVTTHTMVCTAETFVWRLAKLLSAGDKDGVAEMIKGKQGFIVKGPCSVRVIQHQKIPGYTCRNYEVRILDDSGKSGWIPANSLCNKYMKEVIEERPLSKDEIAKEAASKKAAAEKAVAKDEDRAAELLKAAKRWLSEGDKELALRRLDELLKRFPKSKVAAEARKMRGELEKGK